MSVFTDGKMLDALEFDDLLSEFENLDVPLYLHPGIAPKALVDSYYTFPSKPKLTSIFSAGGWGWHNECAIHAIRLALSGALDGHSKLKVVVGHNGEMMPMILQRSTLYLPRTLVSADLFPRCCESKCGLRFLDYSQSHLSWIQFRRGAWAGCCSPSTTLILIQPESRALFARLEMWSRLRICANLRDECGGDIQDQGIGWCQGYLWEM